MTMISSKKTTNEERTGLLAKKLKEGRILRFIEVHNGLSGLIVNNMTVGDLEFDGFWESSFTDSASKGLPDIELVSFDSRLATVNQIMEVTQKPMIVDGDTGGDPNQFEYLIKRLEKAGVSMVIIEDKIFPKRNSLDGGARQELENPEVFGEKITRGQAVKTSQDFLIVARLESLIAGLGVKDALNRAVIYLQAGADGIMIHSNRDTPDEIFEFVQKFKELPGELIKGKLLVCVPTTYHTITEKELAAAGFNIVIYANHLLRSSFAAMEKVAQEILIRGRSSEVLSQCTPVEEVFKKVGFLEVKKKDKESAEKFGSKVRVLIPAAGRDFLSEKYQLPRALIDINGKNILQRQIETFKKVGLNQFAVITGYQGDLFKMANVNYYPNPNYDKEYILSSLLSVGDYLNHPFIFAYSDILFDENIIRSLLKVTAGENHPDIALVVDNAFQYREHQTDKELDLVITKNKKQDSFREVRDLAEEEIVSIGKKIDKSAADYEFNGIAYFSEKGAEILKEVYGDCLKRYPQTPFHEAENIYKANFTDIIQEIVDRDYPVKVLKIHKGWMEIHNENDLNLARELYKND